MATGTMVSLEEYLATAYEPDCDFVDGDLEERNLGEWDHSRLQTKIAAYFFAQYEAQGMRVVTELRLRVTPNRVRIHFASSSPTRNNASRPPRPSSASKFSRPKTA